jgi:FkbM family methyltransferase
MRNAISRVARRVIKPLVYYAQHPTHLLEQERIAAAEGSRFFCNRENLIERSVLEDGVWERVETAMVKAQLRAGMVTLDVGANIGYFTFLMARAVGASGHVHAFEPTTYAYRRMLRNRSLNPDLPDNSTLNQLGLLAQPSTRVEALEARFSSTIPAHSEPELVHFTTIDAYVERHALTRLDFVKIDVDGYDAQVVRGAQHALRRWKPVLLVELNHVCLAKVGDDVGSYIDELLRLNYSDAIPTHTERRTTLVQLRNDPALRNESWNVLLLPA